MEGDGRILSMVGGLEGREGREGERLCSVPGETVNGAGGRSGSRPSAAAA